MLCSKITTCQLLNSIIIANAVWKIELKKKLCKYSKRIFYTNLNTLKKLNFDFNEFVFNFDNKAIDSTNNDKTTTSTITIDSIEYNDDAQQLSKTFATIGNNKNSIFTALFDCLFSYLHSHITYLLV